MPVVVELPYTSFATTVQISKNGKAVSTASLDGLRLASWVARIPDDAFKEVRRCKPEHPSATDTYVIRDRQELSLIVTAIKEALNKGKLSALKRVELRVLFAALAFSIQDLTYDYYALPGDQYLSKHDVLKQLSAIESADLNSK